MNNKHFGLISILILGLAASHTEAAPRTLRTVGAVQEPMEGAVADTLLQENSAQRSRTIGYLAGLALKALEVGELEERLAALEALQEPRA